MRVVRGKQLVGLDQEQVAAMLAGYERVVADVGAGDGRAAHAYARDHPEAFVVGLDTAKDNLREASRRARRKPHRGGAPNVVYVWASAEDPPPELEGRAGEVHVVLPWGRLLEGLAFAEADVLEGVAALAAPGAAVRIVINCEVWEAEVPARVGHLPELTPDYARTRLAARYAACGLFLTEARMLTRDEVREMRSPWAKRLRQSREWPRFLYLAATAHQAPASRRS